MKKTSAILGVLAALAISALPAFAASHTETFSGGVYSGAPSAGTWYINCSSWSGSGAPTQIYNGSFSPLTNLGNNIYSFYLSGTNAFQFVDASILSLECNDAAPALTFYDSYPACSPSTIAHGTIGSFPSCTISCTSGYTLSAGACVASGGGSSSSPSSTYTLMGITLATGTAAMFLANAASTVSDPGLLEVVALAVGIPLAFYIIHQIIGLLPKGRTGRRS